MPPCDRAREKTMPQADFEALRETLYSAVRNMSREQIIELADDLFECSRVRIELRSWRPNSPTAAQH